jgi:surface antigen
MPHPIALPRLAIALLAGLCASAALAANTTFLGDAPISRMTPEDVDILYAASIRVLEIGSDGVAQTWENPATGAGGVLTPLKSYTRGATRCRDLHVKNHAREIQSQGTVLTLCRTADGQWKGGTE